MKFRKSFYVGRWATSPNFIGLLLFCLSLAVGLHSLARRSLWVDEIYSLYDARHFFTGGNWGFRPLYYLFLRIWMHFAEGDFLLRMPSAIFGAASVVLFYILLRLLGAARTAGWATLLLALSPTLVKHSQQIRMYSLGLLLSLLGSYFLTLYYFHRRPTHLLGWGTFRFLSCITTPFAGLLLVPDMIVLFVGMGLRPQKTKGPILIFSGLVLLSLPFTYRLWNYAPYYAHVWSQISASPTLGEIIDLFLVKLPFGSFAGRGHDYFRFFLTALSATTLIVAVLIPSPVRNHARLSLLYCLLPATCLLVISETFATVWRDRFLLFCLPYLLFTSTLFLEVLWNKSRVTAWLLFSSILLVQCQGLVQYFNEPLPISWREVAQAIGDRPTPNSAIILTRTPRLAPVFAHYGVVKTPVKLIPVSPEATGFAQLWAEITLLHPNYQRLWLVFEQGIEHASLLNSLAAHLASAAERMPFRIGRHLHGSGISFVELEGTNFHR